MESGSARRSSFKGRERAIVSQSNIGTASRVTLEHTHTHARTHARTHTHTHTHTRAHTHTHTCTYTYTTVSLEGRHHSHLNPTSRLRTEISHSLSGIEPLTLQLTPEALISLAGSPPPDMSIQSVIFCFHPTLSSITRLTFSLPFGSATPV